MLSFNIGDFAISFLSILLEGVPFVLLGTMISGLVDAFLPPRLMERILPRSGAASVIVSGLLGLVFPMCECGVVPVIRRLISKGLPVSCALTYMLAAPIVNPIVIITTLMAFQANQPDTVTFLRLAGGYFFAVLVGLVTLRLPLERILRDNIIRTLPENRFGDLANVEAEIREHEHSHSHSHDHDHDHDCGHDHSHDHDHHHPHPPAEAGVLAAAHDHHEHHVHGTRAKLTHALQAGTQDFLDVTFYLIIGAAITALFNTSFPQSSLEGLAETPIVSVFVLQVFAFLLSLCSSSDAFVAATLLAFPLSAKLAFLVFGPMVDIKLLMLYSMVFKRRFITVMCIGLFVGIGLVYSALDPLLEPEPLPVLSDNPALGLFDGEAEDPVTAPPPVDIDVEVEVEAEPVE